MNANAMHRIASAATALQALARSTSQSPAAIELGISFQVLCAVNAMYAWKLIEVERSPGDSRHARRILSFESFEQIRNALDERLAWIRADEEFRATHMAVPGGFPGVTADWVHSRDFDAVFGSSRYLLRKQLCATPASYTQIAHR